MISDDLKALLVSAAGELTAGLVERTFSALGTALRGTPQEQALREAYTQATAAFLTCLDLPQDAEAFKDWNAHVQDLLVPVFNDDRAQAALTDAALHEDRPEAVDPAPIQAVWAERHGEGAEATLPWRAGLGLPDAVRAFARAFEHEAEARPELHTYLIAARLKRIVDLQVQGARVEGMETLLPAVERLADQQDRLVALFTALARMGYGVRSVSAGRDVVGSVIITGDNNQVVVADGRRLAQLVRALPDPQCRRAEAIRQIALYRRALVRYCEELPCVSLPGARGKRPRLSTLYVRRRVQRRPDEPALTPPPLPSPPSPSPLQRGRGEGGGMRARLPTAEAVRHHRHLVLLGRPGAGKSTWLHYTVKCLAEGRGEDVGVAEPLLPVLVRLGPLSHERGSFPERLRAILESELGLPLPGDFFETWPTVADAPGWLLACDGLDEVGDPETRRNVARWLEGLAEGPHRVLVTSRSAGYETVALQGERFATFELEPFDPEEAAAFARRWFGAFLPQEQAEAKAEGLLRAADDRGLSGLLSNPLLVTVMAAVYHERDTFPARRKDLYGEFIGVFLEEAERRGVTGALEQELHDGRRAADLILVAQVLLEVVALTAHRKRATDEATLAGAVVSLLEDEMGLRRGTAEQVATRWLRVMGRWSGVLVARGGEYEFLHPTFREYLAARALVEAHREGADGLWVELEPHLLEEEWAEVVPLALAHLDDATSLLERLLVAHEEDEAHQRPLFRAAAALAEGAAGVEAVRRQVVDGLEHLARTRTPLPAVQPLIALERLGREPYAAQRLLAVARDEGVDPWVRVAAAKSLGRVGRADEAISILLALARGEGMAPWIREEAAAALGELGRADEAAQAWLALARDEGVDPEARVGVAVALGELGRADEAASILLALARDEGVDLGVRWWAAAALDELGRADDLLALARDEGVDPEVRWRAAEALDELGRADDLLALARDEGVDLEVRWQSAVALDRLDWADEAAQAWLALACDEGVEPEARVEAAAALGRLGRVDEAASILLALAHDEGADLEVREEAAEALGELGQADEAAQAWLTLVRDEGVDPEVRVEAAWALGELGRADEAASLLLALACDERVDLEVRWRAAEALGELGRADEAASILLALAHDEGADLEVRWRAAEALGELGRADEAAQTWLALARDEGVDLWVRRQAAVALGRLGRADEAAQAWLALARDEGVDPSVRVEAAEVLGRLGRADEAASTLLALAHDEGVDPSVRWRAAAMLGELGRAGEAAPILLALARDGATKLGGHVAAVWALGRLGRADDLLALARDEGVDPWVREKAAEALGRLGRAAATLEVLAGLRALAENPAAPKKVRRAVERALGCLEG